MTTFADTFSSDQRLMFGLPLREGKATVHLATMVAGARRIASISPHALLLDRLAGLADQDAALRRLRRFTRTGRSYPTISIR